MFRHDQPHQQETLSAKEGIIQNLISEKKVHFGYFRSAFSNKVFIWHYITLSWILDGQALHFELGSLNFFVRKIQDTVMHMNEEVRGYGSFWLLINSLNFILSSSFHWLLLPTNLKYSYIGFYVDHLIQWKARNVRLPLACHGGCSL